MAKPSYTTVPLASAITDQLKRINSGMTAAEISEMVGSGGTGPYPQYRDGSNKHGGRDVNSQGMFAGWPATTPKYMRHVAGRNRDFLETLARMYVRVNTGKRKQGKANSYVQRIINTFAEAETREIAGSLIGNGGTAGGMGYIDFFLQRVDHPINEKFQVVETLSDNYVAFFFGQKAPVFSYSGVVMNSYQDDWAMRLLRIFRDIGRGSQLARRGLLFYIKYDSMIVSGVMLNLNFTLNAQNEMLVPFSFQFLVKKVHILYGGMSPPTQLPEGSAFLPDDYNLVETTYRNLKPRVTEPAGDPVTGGTVVYPEGVNEHYKNMYFEPITESDPDAEFESYAFETDETTVDPAAG